MTATGWSYEQIDRASMCDICDLLEYWLEEPPAHVVLGAVHMERKGKRAVREEDAMESFGELQGMMGQRPQPMPAHLKDMMRWAQEQEKKMARPTQAN